MLFRSDDGLVDLAQLKRAAEIDQAVVSKYAPDDEDFTSLKDDPEFLEIVAT